MLLVIISPALLSVSACLLGGLTLRRSVEQFSIILAHDEYAVSSAHDLLLVRHLRRICSALIRCKGYHSVRRW